MKQVWDISRPLTNTTAPWPGDRPFQFEWSARIQKRSSVNIGAIMTSLHNGTHADAPFHFLNDGARIDSIAAEKYLGDAVVLDLSGKFPTGQGTIEISDLRAAENDIRAARRVLIKTNCFPDSTKFPKFIPVLSAEAAAWLGEMKVVLFGIDAPSVDPLKAKELTIHRSLARSAIAILESLDLREVAAGRYQMAALPLKIVGGDAAPVRAVLWRD